MQQAFRGMTLLDYAINASLILSYIVLRKEDKAGLITFDEHFDTFVPASRQSGQMQTLLENLYSQQATFGETDFSSLCMHLNKCVNKRSLLILYANFSGAVDRFHPEAARNILFIDHTGESFRKCDKQIFGNEITSTAVKSRCLFISSS